MGDMHRAEAQSLQEALERSRNEFDGHDVALDAALASSVQTARDEGVFGVASSGGGAAFSGEGLINDIAAADGGAGAGAGGGGASSLEAQITARTIQESDTVQTQRAMLEQAQDATAQEQLQRAIDESLMSVSVDAEMRSSEAATETELEEAIRLSLQQDATSSNEVPSEWMTEDEQLRRVLELSQQPSPMDDDEMLQRALHESIGQSR